MDNVKTASEMYGFGLGVIDEMTASEIAKNHGTQNLGSMGIESLYPEQRPVQNSYVIKISCDGEIRKLQIRNCTDILNAFDMFGVIDRAGLYHNPLSDYPHPKVKVKKYKTITAEARKDKTQTYDEVIEADRDYVTDIEVRCNHLLSERKDIYNYIASKLTGESLSGDVFINAQCIDQNGDLSPRGFQKEKNVDEIIAILNDMVEKNETLTRIEEKKPTRVDNLRPTEFRGLGTGH